MPSPKQTSFIFGLARRRGLDIDAVRAMTPQGSVKKMSALEASVLIDAMQQGDAPDYSKPPRGYHKKRLKKVKRRAPKNVVRPPTPDQMSMWEALLDKLAENGERNRQLRIRLDKPRNGDDAPVTAARVLKWLGKRHYATHGGAMNRMLTSDDCKECIELLKAVIGRSRKATQRLQDEARQRSAASETAA